MTRWNLVSSSTRAFFALTCAECRKSDKSSSGDADRLWILEWPFVRVCFPLVPDVDACDPFSSGVEAL